MKRKTSQQIAERIVHELDYSGRYLTTLSARVEAVKEILKEEYKDIVTVRKVGTLKPMPYPLEEE